MNRISPTLAIPLLLCLLTAWALPATAQDLALDPNAYSIRFRIKNAGFWVDGTLHGLRASGQFDPADIPGARFRASAEVNTINTGITARDKHLLEEKYFYAEKYPHITLVATSILPGGPEHQFIGDLTIKGITREVRFPFRAEAVDGGYRFSGSLTIDRTDFDVGGNSLLLGNQVDVFIACTLVAK